MATAAVGEPDKELATVVANDVERQVTDRMTVSQIQDLVVIALLARDGDEIHRAYVDYRTLRDKTRGQRPDDRAVMDYVHAARYAQPGEDWNKSISRVEQMHCRRFGDSAVGNVFSGARERKFVPSMRTLQFAGKAIEVNNCRAYNCAFTLANRTRYFAEVFWMLLSGTGVGFSTQRVHVGCLPRVMRCKKVLHHEVEDTIEGWSDAMNALAIGSLITGDDVEFSYARIRDEGAPLVTSGGKAPGHIPLKRALEQCRSVFNNAAGRRFRPIEVLDLTCYLAQAVLSGGIRRASLICLFDADDTEMLYAKAHGNFRPSTGPNDPGHNNQRALSNNSAVILPHHTFEDMKRVVEIAREWGEPGVFFSKNRRYGCNPCGEIGLDPTLDDSIGDRTHLFDWRNWNDYGHNTGVQFCNLTEVNAAACQTIEELIVAVEQATIVGTMQAAYTDFPYLGPVTKQITERDALLGVSLTGLVDSPWYKDMEALNLAASVAVATNQHWASKLGIKAAARVTTIKPSGTASLVLGCVGSGVHPHHAKRYFRRVVANINEPAAQRFREANPHMIEVKTNRDIALVFPVQTDGLTISEESGVSFMARIFDTYEAWVKPGSPGELTHNISCTVTLKDNDWEDAIELLWCNRDRCAAMSFIGEFNDKSFAFAPREAVTTEEDEVRWARLISEYVPVDYCGVHAVEYGSACEGPSCEVKPC